MYKNKLRMYELENGLLLNSQITIVERLRD